MRLYQYDDQFLVDADVHNGTSVVTMHWCSGSTGYVDESTGTYYEPRIKNPGNMESAMFSSGKTSGSSTLGFGEIVLLNQDGGLDCLLDYGLDGRTAMIKQVIAATGAIVTLVACSMDLPTFTDDEVSINVKDPSARIAVPIQTNKYAGTNVLPDGTEGTSDIQGKPKPLVFGQVFNISPVCVNTSKLVYQAHESALNDLPAAYDKGISLTRGADYASSADMLAVQPAPGQYRAWLGGGMFRLGSSPAGQVTCDAVEGSTGADRSAAQIAKRAVKRVLSDSDLNAASFSALDAANSAVEGVYIDSETDITSVLDTVLNGIGGWYAFDALGKFNVGRLEAPAGDPVMTLTSDSILSVDIQPSQDDGKGLPVYQVNLNYDKNNTVQTDLAGSLQIQLSSLHWEGVTQNLKPGISTAYGNGFWFTLANDSGDPTASFNTGRISTDGKTWSAVTLPESLIWNSTRYVNGLFFISTVFRNAGSPYNGNPYASRDCMSWTLLSIPLDRHISSAMAYGNGTYLTISDHGYCLLSSDGITWTQVLVTASVSSSYSPLASVAYGPAGFVIGLTADATKVLISSNGSTWTEQALPTNSATGFEVLYGNGTYMLIEMGSQVAFYSHDAATWTALTFPVQGFWRSLEYTAGYWMFLSSSNVSMLSIDSVNWLTYNVGADLTGYYTVFGDNCFMALNNSTLQAYRFALNPNMLLSQWLANQYRNVLATDTSVLVKHPLATVMTITSTLVIQSDAQAEANRQLTMRKVRRDYIKVRLSRGAIGQIPVFGSVIKVVYSRYGYTSGRLFRLIGVERDYATGKISLDLWG